MAPTNTRGFSSLPAELYLEIASHYGSSHVSSKQQTIYDGKSFERRTTLLALSQTCVKLRDIFLPLAWQQVELREGEWLMVHRSTCKLTDSNVQHRNFLHV